MKEPCILFVVEGTTYAVRAMLVQMVDMLEQVTRVPNAPPWVDGIVSVRGEVVPVVNLGRRFGFEGRPLTLESRLIVVSLEGRLVGLAADQAREFRHLDLAEMQPPPDSLRGNESLEGVLNTDGRLILLLDPTRLLKSEEIANAL